MRFDHLLIFFAVWSARSSSNIVVGALQEKSTSQCQPVERLHCNIERGWGYYWDSTDKAGCYKCQCIDATQCTRGRVKAEKLCPTFTMDDIYQCSKEDNIMKGWGVSWRPGDECYACFCYPDAPCSNSFRPPTTIAPNQPTTIPEWLLQTTSSATDPPVTSTSNKLGPEYNYVYTETTPTTSTTTTTAATTVVFEGGRPIEDDEVTYIDMQPDKSTVETTTTTTTSTTTTTATTTTTDTPSTTSTTKSITTTITVPTTKTIFEQNISTTTAAPTTTNATQQVVMTTATVKREADDFTDTTLIFLNIGDSASATQPTVTINDETDTVPDLNPQMRKTTPSSLYYETPSIGYSQSTSEGAGCKALHEIRCRVPYYATKLHNGCWVCRCMGKQCPNDARTSSSFTTMSKSPNSLAASCLLSRPSCPFPEVAIRLRNRCWICKCFDSRCKPTTKPQIITTPMQEKCSRKPVKCIYPYIQVRRASGCWQCKCMGDFCHELILATTLNPYSAPPPVFQCMRNPRKVKCVSKMTQQIQQDSRGCWSCERIGGTTCIKSSQQVFCGDMGSKSGGRMAVNEGDCWRCRTRDSGCVRDMRQIRCEIPLQPQLDNGCWICENTPEDATEDCIRSIYELRCGVNEMPSKSSDCWRCVSHRPPVATVPQPTSTNSPPGCIRDLFQIRCQFPQISVKEDGCWKCRDLSNIRPTPIAPPRLPAPTEDVKKQYCANTIWNAHCSPPYVAKYAAGCWKCDCPVADCKQLTEYLKRNVTYCSTSDRSCGKECVMEKVKQRGIDCLSCNCPTTTTNDQITMFTATPRGTIEYCYDKIDQFSCYDEEVKFQNVNGCWGCCKEIGKDCHFPVMESRITAQCKLKESEWCFNNGRTHCQEFFDPETGYTSCACAPCKCVSINHFGLRCQGKT